MPRNPTIQELFENLQLHDNQASNDEGSSDSSSQQQKSQKESETIAILRKLALGDKFYNSLNYEGTEEESNYSSPSNEVSQSASVSSSQDDNHIDSQHTSNKTLLKRDVITARKHQQHLQQMAQNDIEQDQLNILLQETQESVLSQDESTYYKSVKKIRDDIQEKLGEQIQFATDQVRNRLKDDEERLLEAKTRQMMQYKQAFDKEEELRSQLEEEELQQRRDWKKKLSGAPSSRKQRKPQQSSPAYAEDSTTSTSPHMPNSARSRSSGVHDHSNVYSPRTRQRRLSGASNPGNNSARSSRSNRRNTYAPLNMEEQSSSREVRLLMTVDIGDGRIDTIKVYQDEQNFEKLARRFQKKHRLTEQVIGPLTEHIRSNVEALERDSEPGYPASSSRAPAASASAGHTSARSTSSRGRDRSHMGASSKRASTSRYNHSTKSVENRIGFAATTNPHSTGLDSNTRPAPDADPLESVLREKPQIDEKSRRLARRVKDMDKPVYIRLFQQAVEQRKKREDSQMTREEEKLKQETNNKISLSAQSKALTQSRTKGKFANYGHKLYTEGVMQRMEKEKQSELQQKINQTKEELQHTFKPEISEYARQLSRTREDLLKRITDNPKRHLEAQKLQQLEEEEANFPFKPTINEKSAQLMQQKESRRKAIGAAHYELLFRDAERRRMKKQEYSERMIADATFHPQLKSSRKLDTMMQRGENFGEFIDRLTYSKQMQEQQMQRELQSDIDPSTGRRLFVPNVDRPTRAKRAWEERSGAPLGSSRRQSAGAPAEGSTGPNVGGSNIHLDLYLSRQQLDEEKERMKQQREMEFKKMAETSHVKSRSKRIAESALSKRLRSLFDSFDTDKTGLINIRSVDFNSLDELLVEMLQFIFQRALEEEKAHLSFNEFFQMAKLYIKKTSIHGPKNSALSTWMRAKPASHREQEAEQCTFKPQLTKRSKELAHNKRPRSAKKKRIEYLSKEKTYWMNRTNDLKEQLEKQRNEDCTFHPNPKGKNKIRSDDVEMLTQRLTTQKQPAHNEVLTTDEIRFRENCTFAPDLRKPRIKVMEPSYVRGDDDLNQSYAMLQQQRKLNSFLNSDFADLMRSGEMDNGGAMMSDSTGGGSENFDPNLLVRGPSSGRIAQTM